MLSEKKLNEFKGRLLNTKEELDRAIGEGGNFDLLRSHFHDATGDLSSYDNHPGDEGTELYEREKDIALYEHYQNEIRDINKALEAMDNGTYGKCKTCSEEIPAERLEILPATLYCKEHSPSGEVPKDRPVEEEVLMPPFGKFDMDDRKENVAFDAEDSWQDVALYGTSESPSDFADPPADYDDMYVESHENIGYVEDYENYVGVDITGKNVTVYPTSQLAGYEEALDEEGIMTSFGDLPPSERDPYVEEKKE
ncbi:TraR/DksA C4-type zinc finger protein [Bacillus massiliglaciei]|uniref:TraR/DksA C4-type zinc finger protein n=1 Tax=Bacillus massiliglaciei TaxID=1816693 RepID=UPI000AD14434|nr:TraR/DksA C4-type zinc finger protein [Bacillus massiliglaciei]